MPIKTRDPHSLADDNYIQFGGSVVTWCTTHHTDPDHAPMDTQFEPKLFAFALKLQEYRNVQEQAGDRKKEVDGPGKDLHDLMIGLNRIIPTVFDGDESMLGYFSLVLPIPTDYDMLLLDARACRDYWDSLCDPAPPAEYAAVAFLLDQIAVKITALEDAREAWTLASQKVDQVQNEKIAAREEAHHVERLIFSWYRGLHTDPYDEYWTGTPWGASWGDGEQPVEGVFPQVMTGVKIQLVNLAGNEFLVFSTDTYTGNTGCDVRIAWKPTGGSAPSMPGIDDMTNVPFPVQYNGEILYGKTIYVWVRARNGEEVSDWSEVASLDVGEQVPR